MEQDRHNEDWLEQALREDARQSTPNLSSGRRAAIIASIPHQSARQSVGTLALDLWSELRRAFAPWPAMVAGVAGLLGGLVSSGGIPSADLAPEEELAVYAADTDLFTLDDLTGLEDL